MTILLVQGDGNLNGHTTATTPTTIPVTMNSNPRPGNILIMCVAIRDNNALCQVEGITDANNVIKFTVQLQFRAGNEDVEIWAALILPGTSPNLTVTLNTAPSTCSIYSCFEFSGLLTQNFLDQTATLNNGSVTTGSTGTTPITTQPNELWIGILAEEAGNVTPPITPGFTLYDGVWFNFALASGILIDIVNKVGAANATATVPQSVVTGCIATFIASVAMQVYGDGLTSYIC